MKRLASESDFEQAAKVRDDIKELGEKLLAF
jgi:protein-arginine kinase activator protein McsA